MSRPPAAWVRRTSAASSTVPAPTRQSACVPAAKAAMLANGSGELRGTSMMRKPAVYSTSATPMTRSGVDAAQNRDQRILARGDFRLHALPPVTPRIDARAQGRREPRRPRPTAAQPVTEARGRRRKAASGAVRRSRARTARRWSRRITAERRRHRWQSADPDRKAATSRAARSPLSRRLRHSNRRCSTCTCGNSLNRSRPSSNAGPPSTASPRISLAHQHAVSAQGAE